MIQYQSPTLTIFESELYRTTSTLIKEKDYVLLIDPNWLKGEVDFIYDHCRMHQENKKSYLLFTHADYDHIIGYGKFPDFHCIASQPFVDNTNKAEKLGKIKAFDQQYYIQRDYPIDYPVITTSIQEDGQQLMIGKDSYLFYLAPGHTADGLIIFNQTKGILIVGDYLSNIEFPFIYHSITAYLQTLDKLEKLIQDHSVNYLIVGHGDHTKDKKEMFARIKASRKYIDQLFLAVKEDIPFDISSLVSSYPLALGMRSEHENNLKMAQHK